MNDRPEQLQNLVACLVDLERLLLLDPRCQWTRHFSQCLATARLLSSAGASQEQLDQLSGSIMSVYGGMGSFNDYAPARSAGDGVLAVIPGMEKLPEVSKRVLDAALSLRLICQSATQHSTAIEVATRDSSKMAPIPSERAALNFSERYSTQEFERIARGLIPQAMEDKWIIFFEEPWLYFHRSWTGFGIYGVRFEQEATGWSATEAWVSRNADQYSGSNIEYETALLKFLIDALLLERPASFPAPAEVAANVPPGLHQHSVVGKAYPEIAIEPRRGRVGLMARLWRLLGWG